MAMATTRKTTNTDNEPTTKKLGWAGPVLEPEEWEPLRLQLIEKKLVVFAVKVSDNKLPDADPEDSECTATGFLFVTNPTSDNGLEDLDTVLVLKLDYEACQYLGFTNDEGMQLTMEEGMDRIRREVEKCKQIMQAEKEYVYLKFHISPGKRC